MVKWRRIWWKLMYVGMTLMALAVASGADSNWG